LELGLPKDGHEVLVTLLYVHLVRSEVSIYDAYSCTVHLEREHDGTLVPSDALEPCFDDLLWNVRLNFQLGLRKDD
jgi:hypothetical protein